MKFTFEPIGIVHSCFKEKFGIPRQPGLAPSARAIIKLQDKPEMRDALRDLDRFSHIWLVFVFHDRGKDYPGSEWKPLVRPPRLGGAKKVGVLGSRSPHRPNPIGLSAVKLDRVDLDARGGPEVHVSGVDLLDQTPVLDIKPYVPFADSLPEANSGWARSALPNLKISFSDEARAFCERVAKEGYPDLQQLIEELLRLDPRPAFQDNAPEGTAYSARLSDFDVHWELRNGGCEVTRISDMRIKQT